ncbi:RAD55 family ATPase [Sandarakinorhabdus sp. DWP1-3-1]|uniref:RAD55 family ATPase n=1 Tax=Sandarakinorhabdus sp. DWP1-3-1 TaxID=2804627 RepID=UPI003CFB7CD5
MITGIEGLDVILGGGLVRGCAYIVQGPPGAGKTVLANQLGFNLARAGHRTLYVSLLSESHDRMLAHMSGMGFYDRMAVPDAISYISAFSTLSAEGLPGLLRLVHAELRRHEASLLVLDGLFVAHDASEDENEFRAFVHELQGAAALSGSVLFALTNLGHSVGAPEHTMVDGGIELLDEMYGARSVRTIIVKKQRGGSHLRGRHQFRITDEGIRIFPRLEAALDRSPAESELTNRIPGGIEGFDLMIGGGYPSGSATIMAGPSGVGKTTVGLQFLAQSTPEEPGLLFGFYETPARIRTKARSVGIDIDGLLASGALEIIWHSPAENLADEIGHKLLEAVERKKVRRVLFDGIGALRYTFVFPERLALFINAINNKLRRAETTIIYTLELPTLFMPDRLLNDELSTMADNIVISYYTRPATRHEGGRHLRVVDRELLILKVRDSSFDTFPEVFHISSEGIRFGRATAAEQRPDGASGVSEGA